MRLLPAGKLAETTRIAHAIADIANLPPNTHQPYAGVSSFAHKAGLHASALKVNAELYNHIHPEEVGNTQRVLVTEMAGRASVEMKGTELGYDLAQHPEVVTRVVDRVKDLEQRGYSFEAADASFELMLADELGHVQRAYEVESWRTIVSQQKDGSVVSEAIVKLRVAGKRIISAAEGNGPVNALDNALREAVTQVHPELADLELVDYKVRILEGVKGTEAVTRVLVSTSDGDREWTTVGVHENVVHASWLALDDAITFGLLLRGGR
jgi:2-isopropylmalate synthase